MSSRCSEVLDAVRRTIEAELRSLRQESGGGRPLALLDIGCWDGSSTARYAEILGGAAHGIEIVPAQADLARSRGVQTEEVDLETQRFPWADATFDVIVVNQVFEHLKNVWLPMSEIARVLRAGGHLIFSVPNLSSVHNRLMLGFGFQPSSIRTFGPHVRGFTYRQAREFVAFGGCFTVRRARGVGFYPLPARLATPLARAWAGGSHTPVIVARREATADSRPWLRQAANDALITEQTHYEPAH